MRINNGKYQFLAQLAMYIFLVLYLIILFNKGDFSQRVEWVSIKLFWNGFSYADIDMIKNNNYFNMPYLWLFFQLLFFLSLKAFYITDLTNTGGFILIRAGVKRFILSKAISLLLYTFAYVMPFFVLIWVVSSIQFLIFKVKSSIVMEWEIMIPFLFIFIIALFIEAAIYELLTIFLHIKLVYTLIFTIIFLSMFSKNLLLISNYTMFSRWYETEILRQHVIYLLLWCVILIASVLIISLRTIGKIDFINEKGE